MCFSEFIGYTCGHTSYEVLRPCPLTTQSPRSPVCTLYARRPFLAREMCPACQRILFRRAEVILEWEHHWMHERGVCGCRIYFPDLIKPRPTHRTTGNFGGDGHVDAGGGGTAAGIPFLYGAEWVEEHRQLHKNGACKCVGDFASYRTPELYRFAAVEVARVKSQERAELLEDLYPILKKQGHGGPSSCVSNSDWTTYHSPVVLRPEKGDVPENVSLGEMTRLSTPTSGWSRPYDPMAHTGAGVPVRCSGSISQVDELNCTNPLFSYACKQGAKMKHPFVDCQTVEYPHPQLANSDQGGTGTTAVALARPLVGLPIGAGPEAAPTFSHVGDFTRCVLHQQKKEDDLLDSTVFADEETRLGPFVPLRKSVSFDFLHRLTDGFFYGDDDDVDDDVEREEGYWVTASVGDRPRENTGFPEYSDSDSDSDDED